MSVIGALQRFLSEYQEIDLVLTDMTRGVGSYALSQSASGALKRDVLGNVTYQNSYIFLMKEHGRDEADRRDNYDFLEGFCEWLEERVDSRSLPVLDAPYYPVSIEVSNASLMDMDGNGDATYQIQIQFIYVKKSEVKNKWLT